MERLRQQVTEQAEQIAEKKQKIADAEKQIADLERQLALRKQNSTNSSKPPSSDGLAGESATAGPSQKEPAESGRAARPSWSTPAAGGRRESRRGAVGAAGAMPALWAWLTGAGRERADNRGPAPSSGDGIATDSSSDHRISVSRVVCPECGQSTRAPVPPEAAGQFGPQLTALIAYLTVVCRMPRRVVEALLAQVLEIEISLGSTQKCWEEASQAGGCPVPGT